MSPEPKGTKKNPSRAHARERAAAELSELIDDPLIDWNDDPLNGSGTAAPDRTRRVDPLESIRAVRDAHRQDLEDGS